MTCDEQQKNKKQKVLTLDVAKQLYIRVFEDREVEISKSNKVSLLYDHIDYIDIIFFCFSCF